MGDRGHQELERTLRRIDGKGYKAYRDVAGAWALPELTLHVDHVQGDPFAAPTRVRVLLDPDRAGFPRDLYQVEARELGVSGYLARAFARAARGASRRVGTGHGGEIGIEAPGQEVLEQTAVRVHPDGGIEARFTVGLPARGRSVMGDEARQILLDRLPKLVRQTLPYAAHEPETLKLHADTNEDARALRSALEPLGLVAFVADGARLPRRSGIDDRPLEGADVVAFHSPASLRVGVELPHGGHITGMGVPTGVTLIVGGGFHGKSTLLRALERGVWDHVPGDGRERVVARADAVKVRAEDGRSVAGVDISPFIDGLPFGRDTHSFSTPNASGSTSQAAAIVEALESGATALLVDEDTSATNFMIRDRRMQALVPKSGEPITPFVDRARDLAVLGVSTVLVVGGSGDYLDVADTVIRMKDYLPDEVTERAREVAGAHPTGREPEVSAPLDRPSSRRFDPRSIEPGKGQRAVLVKVPDARTLLLGSDRIDLAAVEQLASGAQIRAIGRALAFLAMELGSALVTLPDALDRVEAAIADRGLDALDPRRVGDLAAFRRHELAAALNRLRSLRVV
jgi:predicted ABC-class ATPase